MSGFPCGAVDHKQHHGGRGAVAIAYSGAGRRGPIRFSSSALLHPHGEAMGAIRAVVEPGAIAALVDFDRTVTHYEVVEEFGEPRQDGP
jgi:hypothetical protein